MKVKFDYDLSEFEQNLTKLGVKVAATLTARALRAGGNILAEAQRDHAPMLDKKWPGSDSLEPGALKDDINTLLNIDGEKGVAEIYVGPGYDTDYVANWLEKGHDAVTHEEYAKGLRQHRKGQRHETVASFVEPHPFMKPAFDAAGQAAMDKALEVLADGISEELDAQADAGEFS
jgi:HK97 gp10 family phage protein